MKSTTAIFALAGALVLAACSPSGPMSMEEAAEYYQEAASTINVANRANDDRWQAAVDASDLEALNELCGEAEAYTRAFGDTLDARLWPVEIETKVHAVTVDIALEAASYQECSTAADLEAVVAALKKRPEHEAAQELRGLLGLDAG